MAVRVTWIRNSCPAEGAPLPLRLVSSSSASAGAQLLRSGPRCGHQFPPPPPPLHWAPGGRLPTPTPSSLLPDSGCGAHVCQPSPAHPPSLDSLSPLSGSLARLWPDLVPNLGETPGGPWWTVVTARSACQAVLPPLMRGAPGRAGPMWASEPEITRPRPSCCSLWSPLCLSLSRVSQETPPECPQLRECGGRQGPTGTRRPRELSVVNTVALSLEKTWAQRWEGCPCGPWAQSPQRAPSLELRAIGSRTPVTGAVPASTPLLGVLGVASMFRDQCLMWALGPGFCQPSKLAAAGWEPGPGSRCRRGAGAEPL